MISSEHARLYAYSFLEKQIIENVLIQVKVKGLTTLALENENGPLDATTPFQPFGPIPAKGSYLLLGNKELFQKELEQMTLSIEWFNLPRSPVADQQETLVAAQAMKSQAETPPETDGSDSVERIG